MCPLNLIICIARFVKEPKRAACASLVEREEKGFEVALKDEREILLWSSSSFSVFSFWPS